MEPLLEVASSNHNPNLPYQGVSGWEADQGTSDDSSFIILAAGKVTRFPSHMLFKQTREGGWIVNTGTIPFGGALFTDPVISKIMLNFLDTKKP